MSADVVALDAHRKPRPPRSATEAVFDQIRSSAAGLDDFIVPSADAGEVLDDGQLLMVRQAHRCLNQVLDELAREGGQL